MPTLLTEMHRGSSFTIFRITRWGNGDPRDRKAFRGLAWRA
ncbi:hypothetical protein [Dongia sedimenti]|uniref:Uncharacterized protein n=1 Tax=Dongia sedimenti TaxID=3064282 RepID=A0ABU0YGU0_9PROT|nr:hypothetical protein [Rhodospirillaceae bacterium R-7]